MVYCIPVNWHQLIDERNYEMDQVIASVLRRDPFRLDAVVRWIEERLADPEYSTGSKDALKEWRELIRDRGLSGVLDALSDRSANAARLRQQSPFAVIMPQDERMKILTRYEALRPRARPAGV